VTTTEAAKTFYRSTQDLRAGKITPDQMRASNRKCREALSESEWERAKAIALSNDQRVLGY
jgi:hypothetical protein